MIPGRPSERARELIRRGAELVVDASPDWLDKLDEATLASQYMQSIADDPVLVEAVRRSNRSNVLHWAAANISHPGEPVAANIGTESLSFVRDMIRRGVDESAVVGAYRIAQNVGWQAWMRTAFGLTTDVDELRELLDVSARSIALFIDATVVGLYRQIQVEHDELTRGTHAERREIIALILDGAPVAPHRIEHRLGYQLNQHHTAAVIWGDESSVNLADLDRTAEVLMDTVRGSRALSVLTSAATRWVWLPGAPGLELSDVSTVLDDLPGVRVAIGSTAMGVEGFRTSHFDAIATQRMMARLGSTQRVASFGDVELVAMITADPELADRFIRHTLGDFERADPELQRTVLAFVREQCNASRTAARLFVHRNTLLYRLARARELLPRSLEDAGVHVAVALEVLSWRPVVR